MALRGYFDSCMVIAPSSGNVEWRCFMTPLRTTYVHTEVVSLLVEDNASWVYKSEKVSK